MNRHTDQKMTMACILRDLLKNIWVVVALALSISFLSFIAAKITFTPTYSSRTTFVVTRKGSSNTAYTNVNLTSSMVKTFESVMNSQLLHKRVCEEMGLGAMPGTISLAVVPETNLITMTATAQKPDLAFQMLKNTLKIYPEVGDKVLGEVILDPFEKPEYPTHPNETFQGPRVIGYSFFVSFCLILAVLAAAAYTHDTIKSEQEVREKLDTSLFTTVYHEHQYKNIWKMLAGKRKSMRLNDPAVSFLYEETMKKISTKLLFKAKSSGAKVVLITSTVPGEGKSTLAMNLAQDIAHRGRKVLLIEGNLREPGLAKTMHISKKIPVTSWSVCLKERKNPDEYILQIPRYSFDVLLNNTPLPEAAELMSFNLLNAMLMHWRENYDVILIDAPPVQRRSDTEVLAHCSDLSLLVVRQNMAQTKFINDSIDMLEGYGSGLLGCVYNDAIQERGFVSQGHSYGYGYGYGYNHDGYGKYGNYHK